MSSSAPSTADFSPAAQGGVPEDNDYARAGGITSNDPVPVDKDSDIVDSGLHSRGIQNSDAQLAIYLSDMLMLDGGNGIEKDDADAIDPGNMMEERTRGAVKPAGTYREPGDQEGLPSDTGVSSTK